jgi:2-amino-4-hydroxy-6-hydroxymethyldihydropteridine diphosphokinase
VSILPADALVIGLGGNIGSEAAIVERFRRARDALAQLGDVRSAALYRTAWVGHAPARDPIRPVTPGAPEQPPFLNSAVSVRYRDGAPAELIATVLELERLLGRDRRSEPRHGPRAIDLDVLVWGTRTIHTSELEVPHPRLAERRFVLQPLADLFGEEVEVAGARIGAMLRGAAAQICEQVAASW